MKKLSALLCLFTSLSAHESIEKWTITDSMNIKHIADVALSPDNKTALITGVTENTSDGKDQFISQIYKSDLHGTPVPFTNSEHVSLNASWSPDGKWIAFLREEEKIHHLYIIPAQGGEARKLAGEKHPILGYSWSPDSTHIAFVMAETKKEYKEVREDAPFIFTEDKAINHLWISDLSGCAKIVSKPDHFVRGNYNASPEFSWAPSGDKIVYAYTTGSGFNAYFMASKLALSDLKTGQVEEWVSVDEIEALPKFSRDGKWVAYLSAKEANYTLTRNISLRMSNGKWVRTLDTAEMDPYIAGKSFLGWTPESDALYYYYPKGTLFGLMKIQINGTEPTTIDTGTHFISAPTLSPDGTHLGYARQNFSTPPEAYVSSLENFSEKKISHFNEEFCRKRLPQSEVISWRNDDYRIEGILTYPRNYTKGAQYPLVVIVHGGPAGVFSETFTGMPYPYSTALFAEHGYFVLCPNPRGSNGYGRTFLKANIGDWGGGDYRDILAGIDHLKDKIDENRVAICGWSYGGYMTAWAITQSNRFAVASMGAALTNMTSFSGTSDIYDFLTSYLKSTPWDNPQLYLERSPLFQVSKVMAPVLIQSGTADKRVPDSQSIEFFRALKAVGQNPTLILFPGMGHQIEKPKWMVEVMEQNHKWITDHLDGKEKRILQDLRDDT